MTAHFALTAPRAARDPRARRRQDASTSPPAFIRSVLNSLAGPHLVSHGQQGRKNAITCQSRPSHLAASPPFSSTSNNLRAAPSRPARQRRRYENRLDVETFATFRAPRSSPLSYSPRPAPAFPPCTSPTRTKSRASFCLPRARRRARALRLGDPSGCARGASAARGRREPLAPVSRDRRAHAALRAHRRRVAGAIGRKTRLGINFHQLVQNRPCGAGARRVTAAAPPACQGAGSGAPSYPCASS